MGLVFLGNWLPALQTWGCEVRIYVLLWFGYQDLEVRWPTRVGLLRGVACPPSGHDETPLN